MTLTVKKVFDEECSNLKIDNNLARRISRFRKDFEMRNEDHIAFFGGSLTGVQTVLFTADDRDLWFSSIIKTGEYILKDRLKEVPTVDTSRIVTSDTMNLSFVWLLHSLYHSKLSNRTKHQAMKDVCMIMLFKFLTSRLYMHFRYPADINIAQATYAQLSNRFALKQYGSWQKTLEARAEDIISKKSIHYNTIKTMNDEKVGYVLSDTQTRIRDMLKNIYNIHLRVRDNREAIISTSSEVNIDGDILLRDIVNKISSYTIYLENVVGNERTFKKPELVSIIEKMMRTMSPRMFDRTLTWISNNYQQRGAEVLDRIIKDLLLYSLNYLHVNRTALRSSTDLSSMLGRLKGSFMSSRNTDEVLRRVKRDVEKVVSDATGSRHPSIVASVRTGVMLYLVLRTLTKNHYETLAL